MKLPASVTDLVAKKFKNANRKELKQFVSNIKVPVEAYLNKLGEASLGINYGTSIFSQMKAIMGNKTEVTNISSIFEQVKSNSGSVSFDSFDNLRDTAMLLDNITQEADKEIDKKLELAKEGYELMNMVANAIHGYETQYEVFVSAATKGIKVSNNLIAFRINASSFMSQLGWRPNASNNLEPPIALGFSGLTAENIGSSRKAIEGASKLFEKWFAGKKFIDFTDLYGTRFDKMIGVSLRQGLKGGRGIGFNFERYRKMQEKARYGATPNDQMPQDDLAFYRGPDYWAFVNGKWIAIQAKAYNASISLSSITGGLNRLIFMISAIEGLLDPQIENQVKENLGKVTIDTTDLIDELVHSVFF